MDRFSSAGFSSCFIALVMSVFVQIPGVAIACPSGGCTNASFYGDYAASNSGTTSAGVHQGVVGVFSADGAGGLSGSATYVDDSTNPVTVVQQYFCSGSGSSYSINGDGTGTTTINVFTGANCTGTNLGSSTSQIVLEDGGRSFRSVSTNGPFLFVGSGRLQ